MPTCPDGASPAGAIGLSLFVHDLPKGVISPVVSRISTEILDGIRKVTLLAATELERRVLARGCGPAQWIVLFEAEIHDQPQPPRATYMAAGRVR